MILTEKDLQLLKSISTTMEQTVRKEPELKIEFDGTTVLCRVCGDKASGFHYGVHSCEGCKGFFRRSIQQKIQYRPCTKNQQCSILRINRNRCQYCRLKKCIAVGMSRDAVRFGRVPKREKAKILAAMQSVNARSQERALAAELEDEALLVATVIKAHEQTCDYTQEKVSPLLQRALEDPVYTQCPTQLACPLNPNPQPLQNGILEDFSERFSPAIRGVVEFAKRIPGFSLLSQDDQVTLLKAGVFEVLLVRLACMFNSQTNTMLCLNGQVLKRESLHSTSNARFLMDSMFDFAERLNQLRLRDSDLGLFCAVVIIAADRPGLRNTELVEKMQSKLMQALQTVVTQGRPDLPTLFQELMKKIPDLRTLNTLHSEKLLAFKMEPRHHPDAAISALSVSALNNYMAAPTTTTPPGAQTSPGWGMMDGHHLHHHQIHHQLHHGSPTSGGDDSKGSWSDRDLVMQSPGQRSTAGSEWSQAESKEAESSSEKSPLGSSKSTGDSESVCSNEVALITDLQSNGNVGSMKRRRLGDSSEGGSSSGDEGSVSDGQHGSGGSIGSMLMGNGFGGGRRCPFKLRKLESPCDSGIESGKEAGSTNGTQSAGTSLCGSPRSLSDEKVKDVEQDGSTIDDMPVLKRTLQAPPLINTNLLMEEAYKPHKKFRALRKEPDVQPSSPELVIMTPTPTPSPPQHRQHPTPVTTGMSVLAQQLTCGTTSSSVAPSLASTHSMLVRTLEQGPRLTEQQMKHTDIIHNYIMGNGDSASSTTNHETGAGRMLYSIPNASMVQQQHCYNGQSAASSTGKGVVVCPPGYYIPHNTPTWPFSSGAVRPAATFVPQQTVVHHHHQHQQQHHQQQQHQLQPPPRLSPQPPSPSVVVVSASASPQPAGSPKLPRMYYDPRSTTPTSQVGQSTGSTGVAASAVVPVSTGYLNYGCGVVASKTAIMSPMGASKPASPLAGQVLEIQQVTGSDNQPLNLSKKVALGAQMHHKVKIEMSS